ncbi:hypothetical protein M5689_015916 [Euphorbia peplus]|nr:hypothetical protein M5689_015916 [Euphorbia peplus]
MNRKTLRDWSRISSPNGPSPSTIDIQLQMDFRAHLKFRNLYAITFSMALSSYYMQEMDVISNDYSNPFEFCFDTSTTCEDLSPFFESLGYPAPYQKDDTFYNIPALYEQDEVFPAISHCEQDLLPYWRNWDGEYGSCFTNSGYTDDNSFCNALEKTEIQFQSEEYGDNGFLNYDSLQRQQISVDDRCWTDCESWFGYVNEEDSNCEKQGNYVLDETALYEAIFGYWPCLMQEQQLPFRD